MLNKTTAQPAAPAPAPAPKHGAAGWAVVDSACHRELESPIARFLGYAAPRSVPVPA